MEIIWLGHSCFRLRGRSATVLTDPYPASLGLKLGRQEADLVTVSHADPNHSNVEVAPDAFPITGPGEYEVAGVSVTGIRTFHDNALGMTGGLNTAYLIEIDDVRVCHLGDLGHKLDDAHIEAIGPVDVLLIPVGGGATLTAAQAAEVTRQIEPRIVVPMHFALPGLTVRLDPAETFLKEMGVTDSLAVPKLSISAGSGAVDSTKVILLECRAGLSGAAAGDYLPGLADR